MVRIYTKTGDEGETSLFGGQRVPKDAPRVEAYGAVDELNAVLGVVVTLLRGEPVDDLVERLTRVQRDLFALGADLATPLEDTKAATWVPRIGEADVERLERWIDEAETTLPPMTAFILPGGALAAAHLHVARTVCRRAERRVVTLSRQEPLNPHARVYLNRLGDLLFVWSRLVNHRLGVAEQEWSPSPT